MALKNNTKGLNRETRVFLPTAISFSYVFHCGILKSVSSALPPYCMIKGVDFQTPGPRRSLPGDSLSTEHKSSAEVHRVAEKAW